MGDSASSIANACSIFGPPVSHPRPPVRVEQRPVFGSHHVVAPRDARMRVVDPCGRHRADGPVSRPRAAGSGARTHGRPASPPSGAHGTSWRRKSFAMRSMISRRSPFWMVSLTSGSPARRVFRCIRRSSAATLSPAAGRPPCSIEEGRWTRASRCSVAVSRLSATTGMTRSPVVFHILFVVDDWHAST